jgi:hypothetical protein
MENREPAESIMFEEKSFNKGIVDSSSFDVISTLEPDSLKMDSSPDEKQKKNISRFVEMPLQINSSIRLSKSRQPVLTVEDKGYKKENFRNYEIALIDEKGEKKLKCYRRFSNFDSLNQKLRERYPFVIIPTFPKKNYKVKLITVEEEFYWSRTKSLKAYLNYLFRHDTINICPEFVKFLNDAEFVSHSFEIRMKATSKQKV